MRATVIALGMRGDVQPLLAVAGGLRKAGLTVRCATHPELAGTAQSHGLEFVPLRGRADTVFGGPAGGALRDALSLGGAFRHTFDNYFALSYRHLLEDVWHAVQDADVVVCWPWLRLGASLQDALQVPVVVVSAYPPMYLPTAGFANPYQIGAVPCDTRQSCRRSWRLALSAYRAGETELARWREQTLGLAPITWRAELRAARALTHVLTYSTRVLPRPADWPETVHVAGYAFDASAEAPSPDGELAALIGAAVEGGATPRVAIGFSSQFARNGPALARAVEGAVRLTGVRAVVTTGLGALKAVAPHDRLAVVQWAPHEWLFARVDAVVHHGGSGSVGMALRHGLPSVAVPFGYDQRLWGTRLHALGAGAAPLDPTTLSSDGLAHAIDTLVSQPRLRDRARVLQREIAEEDGVRSAVRVIVDAAAGSRGRTASLAARRLSSRRHRRVRTHRDG